MLYTYDKAIVDDLFKSFNPDVVAEPVVKVIGPEEVIGLAAQIQNDEIKFPIIALSRADDYQIDTNLLNFTKSVKGIPCGIDNATNQIYSEHSLPVTLSYALTVLTTNQADMDELVRELLFKFQRQYFLKITIPYESKRQIRFGLRRDDSRSIEQTSRQLEYIQEGKLYQTIIPLTTDGCVLVHYTKSHLVRHVTEVSVK